MHRISPHDLAYAKERADVIGWVPNVRGGGGKINPHMTRLALSDNTVMDIFHVKPVYYEAITGDWRPIEEVTTHSGNHKVIFTWSGFKMVHPRYINWLTKRMELINGELLVETMAISPYVKYLHDLVTVPKIGMTVTPIYPDPSPETTTVDGVVDTYNQGTDWNTVHDLTTSTGRANDSGTTGNVGVVGLLGTGGNNIYICRGFYLFDTSVIGSDTVDSATLSIMPNENGSNGDNDADDWTVIVQSSPASNTAIADGDFDQCGAVDNPTEGSDRIDVTAMTADTYDVFTLNATGRGWIDTGGVSKFGFREGHDVVDSAYAGANSTKNGASHYFSEDTTALNGKDPKLVVTHSAAVTSTFIPSVMMF